MDYSRECIEPIADIFFWIFCCFKFSFFFTDNTCTEQDKHIISVNDSYCYWCAQHIATFFLISIVIVILIVTTTLIPPNFVFWMHISTCEYMFPYWFYEKMKNQKYHTIGTVANIQLTIVETKVPYDRNSCKYPINNRRNKGK